MDGEEKTAQNDIARRTVDFSYTIKEMIIDCFSKQSAPLR
jgi:hypothetical protein